MPQPLIDALLQFLSASVGFEAGSNHFYVVLGVSLAAAIIVARLLCGLFGSGKGIIRTALAVGFPLVGAILGFALVEVYALPHLEAYDWAPLYLPWVGAGLSALLCALLCSVRCWELGAGLTLTILGFAALAGVGGYYGSHLVIDVIAHGEKNLDQRNERIREEIESVD